MKTTFTIVVAIAAGSLLFGQSPPPVARPLRPIIDVLLPASTVSGALLAGVMVSTSDSAKSGDPWLAVTGGAPAGSHLCVTVQSADGRWRAEKLEYEVPSGSGAASLVLPFETEIKHADYAAGLGRDQIAVLAIPGACVDVPPVSARAASWRDARGTGTRQLRVAAITGGRDTKMAWLAKSASGSPKGEVDCRQIRGTSFDAWCEASLPALPPTDLEVTVTSYRLNGRGLAPIQFTVALGR